MNRNIHIKIFLLLLAVSIGIGITTQIFAKEDGAPSGNTGSPGDDNQTCAHVDCHTGTASNRDGLISTNVPEAGYLSDLAYTITVTVSEPDIVKFGFQASPQNLVGTKMGDLDLIDAVQTKLTGGGKYVTHTLSGTAGIDTKTWTFTWNSEDAEGDVTFYVAVNASDNEEDATGDKIYTSSVTIKEDPANNPVSIEELNKIAFDILNPVNDQLHLNISTATDSKINILVHDLKGRLIINESHGTSNGTFIIPFSKVQAGVYFITILNQQGSATKQFIRI